MNASLFYPKVLLRLRAIVLLSILGALHAVNAQQVWNQSGSAITGSTASSGFFGDRSGESVAISNDGQTIIVGSPLHTNTGDNMAGQVRIFQLSGGEWVLKGQPIFAVADGEKFGQAVSINATGSVVAVGAPANNAAASSSGAVRVYTFSGGNWVQMGSQIQGSSSFEEMGTSVSLSDNALTLAVGAPGANGIASSDGVVKIFNWNGTAWVQKGSNITGTASGDNNGRSLSLSANGNLVAIGAPNFDVIDVNTFDNNGVVRVFNWTGIEWEQRGSNIAGTAIDDRMGETVRLSKNGLVLAVAAPFSGTTAFNGGYVKVFHWSGSAWVQRGSTFSGNEEDGLGVALALSRSGDTLAIGAPKATGAFTNQGYAKIFRWTGSTWATVGSTISGIRNEDHLATSLDLSANGATLLVGAPGTETALNDGGRVASYVLSCTSTPTIVAQPASQSVCSGASVVLGFTTTGIDMAYLWNNGATTQNIVVSIAGTYTATATGACGTLVSDAAVVSVGTATSITGLSPSQTVCGGNTATFSVTAVGENLSYSWYNSEFADENNPFSTNPSIVTTIAGPHIVGVIGTCGTVSSFVNPQQLVVRANTAITTQPASATICGSNQATLAVTATGNNLSYLWSTGATTTTIQTTTAGSYMVTVSGTCGQAVSNTATVTIGPNTQITQQPVVETVCEGTVRTTGVTAVGVNLTYQWMNGVDTPTQTTSLPGVYVVTVTGDCGVVASNAGLTIRPATRIPNQNGSIEICEGTSVTLPFAVDGANMSYLWNTGATSPNLTVSGAGVYRVTITGACGGPIVSAPFTVSTSPCGGIFAIPSWRPVGGRPGISAGEAWYQSLAISPSGVPYVAYRDDVNGDKTTVLSFNGTNWGAVGSVGISAGRAEFQSLAISPSGVPYVAYRDGANGYKTTVLSFNGANWGPVGSVGISAGNAWYQSLAISPSGVPYVAYRDVPNGGKTTVLSFNGTNWGAVGSAGISAGTAWFQSLAISPSGVPYVAYQDVANGDKTTVLSFNGINWGVVGSAGISAGIAWYQSLAISPSGVPYVAYEDWANGGKTTVLSFNGTNWGAVGSAGISAGGAWYQSLAISPSGVPYVAYRDDDNGYKTTVLSFNGTNWGAVGRVGISASLAEYQSLAISPSGVPYVAYKDWVNGRKTTVLRLDLPEIMNRTVALDITLPSTFTGTATLTWPTVAGANTYCVRVSTTSNFSTDVRTFCGIAGNSFSFNPANPNGRMEEATQEFYFQVLAVDEEGYFSQWSDTQAFVLNSTGTSVPEQSAYTSTPFYIYPNPAQDKWYVHATQAGTLRVTNTQGVVVHTTQVIAGENAIAATLPKGIYIVQLGGMVQKLVVE